MQRISTNQAVDTTFGVYPPCSRTAAADLARGMRHAFKTCTALWSICGKQMGDVAGLANDGSATNLAGILAKLHHTQEQARLATGVSARQ